MHRRTTKRHCARVELNKSYFEHIVEDAGFGAAVFVESVENQCAYLLRPT